MALSKETVEHIAHLARIKLDETEKNKIAEELGSILNYVGKLNEVDVDKVEPTAQVTGLENVFRADEEGSPSNPSKLVEQFPHKRDSFLKVKQILKKR